MLVLVLVLVMIGNATGFVLNLMVGMLEILKDNLEGFMYERYSRKTISCKNSLVSWVLGSPLSETKSSYDL